MTGNATKSTFNNFSYNHAGGTMTLAADLKVGAAFNLTAGNFSASTFANTVSGVATLSSGTYTGGTGAQTFTGGLTRLAGGSYSSGSSTVVGALIVNSGTYTAFNNDSFGSITMTGGAFTGGGPSNNLTVSGVFDVSAATVNSFTAPQGTLSVGGTWTGGTAFAPNGGTVSFTGTPSQTIGGSSTFFDLFDSAPTSATLTFIHGTTQTITDQLTLTGQSPAQPLALVSDSSGTPFNFSIATAQFVGFVSVKDSHASSPGITAAAGSTLLTGNTNWSVSTATIIWTGNKEHHTFHFNQNWNTNKLPANTDIVDIPSVTRQPVLLVPEAIKDFIIESGRSA